jgi:heme a synthase
VPDSSPSVPPQSPWLSRYAKLVVFAAFWLLFTGGHTTTSGAGMAFPDWPLSHGSLNPTGWWTDTMMFLEHGHRLTAGLVATLIAVLFFWVRSQRKTVPSGAVALALWALIGVLSQAVLGGLRVVLDPQGIAPTTNAIATTFRVFHGCVAQIELCLLVALAAKLSPVWRESFPGKGARFAWVVVAFLFVQLIFGATMRHLGAGLAITTFPAAAADGSWLPATHSAYVDVNFAHTRLGAVVVTLLIAALAARTLKLGVSRFSRPALGLLALVAVQFTLGLYVIWTGRQLMLTTLHVVNGAALLATTVLLAVRMGRSSTPSTLHPLKTQPTLVEATA